MNVDALLTLAGQMMALYAVGFLLCTVPLTLLWVLGYIWQERRGGKR
jgi:hypothetical protein